MGTQNKQVLRHLKNHRYITPLDALREYNIFRLSARIYDLRKMGFIINSELIYDKKNKKKYSKYYICNKNT